MILDATHVTPNAAKAAFTTTMIGLSVIWKWMFAQTTANEASAWSANHSMGETNTHFAREI